MTILLEYRKIKGKHLLLKFQFEAFSDNDRHYTSLDKYLTLNVWKYLYEKLKHPIDRYVANELKMPSAESIAMRHDQLNLSVSWVPCDSMHLKMFGFEAANAYTYLMVIKVRAMSKVDEFNRLRLSKVTHTVESVSKRNEGVSVGNPIIDITENEIDGTENGFESNVKRTEESSSFAPIGPIARLPCVVKSKIQKNKNDVDSLCVYEERQRVAVATVRMNGNDDVNKWPRTDASNESPIDLASIEQFTLKDQSVKEIIDTFKTFSHVLKQKYTNPDDEMDPSDCLELALIPQISTNEQFNAMVDKLTVELMPDETTDDSDEICHIPTIEDRLYSDVAPEWALQILMQKYDIPRPEVLSALRQPDDGY